MIPIPPFMYKLGGAALFLSLIFYAGCHTQKQRDTAKIQKLKATNKEYVEIIEVFQENYDALDQAIKNQNSAVEELGRKTVEAIETLEKRHLESLRRLNESHRSTLDQARSEAEELKQRLSLLTVAEACHQAWLEVVK